MENIKWVCRDCDRTFSEVEEVDDHELRTHHCIWAVVSNPEATLPEAPRPA